jgi:hypothetical protein
MFLFNCYVERAKVILFFFSYASCGKTIVNRSAIKKVKVHLASFQFVFPDVNLFKFEIKFKL